MKPEELSAEQKIELTDEQIEAASGGTGGSNPTNRFTCPQCGSTDIWYHDWGGYVECSCNACGFEWNIPY